ncbi:MAG: hypothetical protein PVG33_07460 [Chloroflexota bacterium]|jgi:hypothetical protein
MFFRKSINGSAYTQRLILPVGLLILLLVGCQDVPQEADNTPMAVVPTSAPTQGITVADEAYPAPTAQAAQQAGYPTPVDPMEDRYLAEPPDPERELPEPAGQEGVVGGVLIQEITGEGYIPLVPLKFMLGQVLLTDTGEPAYIRTGADSPTAELFNSGVFIFHSVEPGDYGLVVDLGFTSFTVQDENFQPRIITVEPDMVLDLGQVITNIPGY